MSLSKEYDRVLRQCFDPDDPKGAYIELVRVMIRSGEIGCSAVCTGEHVAEGRVKLCAGCWQKVRMRYLLG